MTPKKPAAAMPLAIAAADAVKKPRGIYWMGETPMQCGVCQQPLDDTFIDGATSRGWLQMDRKCHSMFGHGLGAGCGQQYDKQTDGRWRKVGG